VQVKQIVTLVVTRATALIAVGLCALLCKVGAPEKGGRYTIAVDGSVYDKYSKFRERLQSALVDRVARVGGQMTGAAPAGQGQARAGGASTREGASFNVVFRACQGGSLFGTAVIAAVESSLARGCAH
jgi:hexokinase